MWQVSGNTHASTIGNPDSLMAEGPIFYRNSWLSSWNMLNKQNSSFIRTMPLGDRPTGAPMTFEMDEIQHIVITPERQSEPMELTCTQHSTN